MAALLEAAGRGWAVREPPAPQLDARLPTLEECAELLEDRGNLATWVTELNEDAGSPLGIMGLAQEVSGAGLD